MPDLTEKQLRYWVCYCGFTFLSEEQYKQAKFDQCPKCHQKLANFKAQAILKAIE